MNKVITSQFCVTSVIDGENALSLSLDNEHEDFLYDDAGNLVSPVGGAVSTIHLYDGNGEEPSFTPSIVQADSKGVSFGQDGAYIAKEDGKWNLHVKGLTADSAEVLISASYGGAYYYAKFTANKVKQDKYDIVVTPNAIAFNPSTYTTQTITIGGTRTDLQGNKTNLAFGTGATDISNVSGSGTIRLHVVYKDANGTSRNEQLTSGSFSVTAGIADKNNGIYFELRKYAGSGYSVCDYETVEIAKVENSIRIDLTNDADMVACDSDGKVKFTRVITTTAKIYDGATAATSGVSVPSGYTKANYALAGHDPASIVISGGVLTLQWTFTAGDVLSSTPSYTLNIPLVYKEVTYTATFTLTRTDASAIYQVLPDPSAVSFSLNSSNELSPSSISLKFSYTKETGSGSSTTQVTSGSIIDSLLYPYYRIKKSGSWSSWTKWATAISGSGITWSSGEASIPNDTEITDIELGLSTASSSPANSTFIDREVIPVIKDGKNGQNSVRMDLDNEMDSIQYQGDGITKVTSTATITTTCYLYDGVSDKSGDVTFSVDTTDTTLKSSSYSLSGRVLTVSSCQLTDNSYGDGYVTLKCTYASVEYKAKFSVKRLVNTDKFDLDLSPNALFLNGDDGWSSDKTVTIKVMRTPSGGGTPTAVNPSDYGLALTATAGTLGSYSSGTKSFVLTVTQTQASSNDNIIISLTKNGDTSKVYDRETIPINKAENGNDAVVYNIECADTIKPGDTSLDVSVKRTEGSSSEILIYSSATGAWDVRLTASMTGGGIPTVAVNGITFSGTITASSVLTLTLYIGSMAVDTKTIRAVANGNPGHTGRWYEYRGDYADIGNIALSNTDDHGWFIKRGDYFHMLISNSGVSVNTSTCPTDTSSTANWEFMGGDRQYYIAKAFFGEYAQFGSFIINGDWMISKYGIIYDESNNAHTIDYNQSYSDYTYNNAYTLFNEDFPNTSWSGYKNFCPNFAVDGRSGTTYQYKGVIGGFSIGSDDLTNTNYSAGITIKDNETASYVRKIVQIGNDAEDSMTERKAAMIAKATEYNTNASDRPYNTALYLEAENATYNYAFHGKGNGVLNGLIFGFKTQFVTIPSGTGDRYSDIMLNNGATIVLKGSHVSGHVVMAAPTLPNVRQCLGLRSNDSTTPFAIEITIINLSSYEFVSVGFRGNVPDTSISFGANYPYLMNYDDGHASSTNIQVAQGDVMKLMLIYSQIAGSSTNYEYRAYRLLYLA